MKMYNIGKQFNDEPASRYFTDTHERSAEVFRERVLKPLLVTHYTNTPIVFILDDDVEGYGSSFLTESFAGLVKYGYIRAVDLQTRFFLAYSNPIFGFYAKRVRSFIDKSIYEYEIYEQSPKSSPKEVSECHLPSNVLHLESFKPDRKYKLV
ncbi:STAS-like domain-containing protein [Vibrio sp. TRT 1302]|uniref:STAS-like domain-containing protein n=1 Tax=Vibrio sp. TRT 1302 TaxID=3418504 RepID=UPI003CFADA79